MINSVKVRMTAIILLILTVISSCFPMVLATGITKETEIELAEESDLYSGKIYRIKNSDNGTYLSLKEIDGSLSILTEKSDSNSPSQYFRFIRTDNGEYVLNCAYGEAEFSVVPDVCQNPSDNSRKPPEDLVSLEFICGVTASEVETVKSLVISDSDGDGSVTFSYVKDEITELFLSNTTDLLFTSDEQKASSWILEEVKITSLSMAYFETRIKLYSVQKFYAKVLPSAVSSFLEWSVDNEDVMLVSDDGTLCALSKGESVLTVKAGNSSYSCRVEVCDGDSFAWFSQENVTNSYWNGGVLSGIKFYGKPFASNGAWDWMEDGCALTSCAMLFRNLGATYTNGYDFRSNQKGDLPADPYTLALANIGHAGFTASAVNYKKDPVLVRWANITNAFKVDGRPMSYYQKYTSNLGYIRDALAIHPEGVVVRMTKSNGETHFVLFTECVNPGERNSSKLRFIVCDPMSYDGSDGDSVPFEKSASYKSGYRYYNISSVIMWNVQ